MAQTMKVQHSVIGTMISRLAFGALEILACVNARTDEKYAEFSRHYADAARRPLSIDCLRACLGRTEQKV